MVDVTVKGLFIQQTLKMLRSRLSPEEFHHFEEGVGIDLKTLDVYYFKNYPVELQNRVEQAAARALWGSDDEEAFYRFGQLSFETFAASAIGRTLLILAARSPTSIVKSAGRLMSAVTTGMQIEVKVLDDHQVSFRFRNNPYRVKGWQGVVEAALRYTGVQPRVKVVMHGGADTEYLASWD